MTSRLVWQGVRAFGFLGYCLYALVPPLLLLSWQLSLTTAFVGALYREYNDSLLNGVSWVIAFALHGVLIGFGLVAFAGMRAGGFLWKRVSPTLQGDKNSEDWEPLTDSHQISLNDAVEGTLSCALNSDTTPNEPLPKLEPFAVDSAMNEPLPTLEPLAATPPETRDAKLIHGGLVFTSVLVAMCWLGALLYTIMDVERRLCAHFYGAWRWESGVILWLLITSICTIVNVACACGSWERYKTYFGVALGCVSPNRAAPLQVV